MRLARKEYLQAVAMPRIRKRIAIRQTEVNGKG